jgi:hypothetical protein
MQNRSKNTWQYFVLSYNIGILLLVLQRFKTTEPGETNLNRQYCSAFWRKFSVYLSIKSTWWMDLLDEAVVHSNLISLLHLRIRDQELDCHEFVTLGLRQHSHRQLHFRSQEWESAEISEFAVHHVGKKLKLSLSFLRPQRVFLVRLRTEHSSKAINAKEWIISCNS